MEGSTSSDKIVTKATNHFYDSSQFPHTVLKIIREKNQGHVAILHHVGYVRQDLLIHKPSCIYFSVPTDFKLTNTQPIVWVTAQKGGNPDVEWVETMLRPNIQTEDFHNFSRLLFFSILYLQQGTLPVRRAYAKGWQSTLNKLDGTYIQK